MSDLVSLSDLKDFLGDPPDSDDELLTDLLEHVEGLFESATGRTETPFGAGANRTEVRDGTGTAELFLDYPPSTVTSIKLGYDPADPVETLDVADPHVVTFAAGKRRLSRTDGGTFGDWLGQPRYVQIVYTSQTETPEDVQLAIKSVCAIAYRRRGAEEAISESDDGYSRVLAAADDVVTTDPFWTRAVDAHRTRRSILA